MRFQVGPVGKDNGTLDGVLQFTNVAGPVMVHQHCHCRRGNAFDSAAQGFVQTVDEEPAQQRNILLTFPQRGQSNGDDIQPVEEIFPEITGSDLRFEILRGGRDDAHIHCAGFISANRTDLALLKHPQQFGLQRDGDVTDFIEKQRAMLSHFEQSLLVLVSTGKRPFDVTEQFTFHEAFRYGRTVDGHHGTVLAFALPVNPLGNQFLAGTALSSNQYSAVETGHFQGHGENCLHGRALAHHVAEREITADPADAGLEFEILSLQPLPLFRLFDG